MITEEDRELIKSMPIAKALWHEITSLIANNITLGTSSSRADRIRSHILMVARLEELVRR